MTADLFILNEVNLSLQLYTKFFLYGMRDFNAQRIDLCTFRVTIINQDQRLLCMTSCIALSIAFPASLFDQPSCSKLH